MSWKRSGVVRKSKNYISLEKNPKESPYNQTDWFIIWLCRTKNDLS